MKQKVLFDSDVLLDVFLQRQPHAPESIKALHLAIRGEVQGYISAHAVPTVAYFIARELGQEKTKELVRSFLGYLSVAPVTENTIKQALSSKIRDFEDAITHYAALSERVTVIVTRNTKDFSKGDISAVLPEIFNTPTEKHPTSKLHNK